MTEKEKLELDKLLSWYPDEGTPEELEKRETETVDLIDYLTNDVIYTAMEEGELEDERERQQEIEEQNEDRLTKKK